MPLQLRHDYAAAFTVASRTGDIDPPGSFPYSMSRMGARC